MKLQDILDICITEDGVTTITYLSNDFTETDIWSLIDEADKQGLESLSDALRHAVAAHAVADVFDDKTIGDITFDA